MLYDKHYICPVCKTKFTSKKVMTDAIKIKSYEKDLKPVYEGVNVLLYSIIVCTNCKYSAFEQDFEKSVPPQYINDIRSIQDKIKAEYNFSDERDTHTAIASYAMAALYYIAKKNNLRAGECFLRMGWLYREIDDKENEEKTLARALHNFTEGFMKSYIDPEKEPMILFYLGYLNYRFNRKEESVRFFSDLLTKYKGLNSYYVKVGRELWQELRGEE